MHEVRRWIPKVAIAVAILTAHGAAATPWAVVTSNHDRTIHVLDLATSTPTLYGPYFTSNELGATGSVLDVAATPDGRYALVSAFDGQTIYRLDLTTPTSPVVADSVALSFSPEDIAITPDGANALVVGGSASNQVAVLRLVPLSVRNTYTLTTDSGTASCVAVGPDGTTVVLCDPPSNRIIVASFEAGSAQLTGEATLSTGIYPVNAQFSPDGATVLVANGGDTTVSVFAVTAPGVLAAGTTSSVTGLPGWPQSVAFSPDGSHAYVMSEYSSPDKVSVLDVAGAGNVTLGQAGAALLLGDSSTYLRFGVDALAVTPDASKLLAANPGGGGTPSPDLSIVALSDYGVSAAATNSDAPTAVDILAPCNFHLDLCGPTIFVDGFESGSVSAWSQSVP